MTEVFRMHSASGGGHELKRHEDVIFPNLDMIDPKWGINYGRDFKYKSGDIMMCSYPKSGTHWMKNMIAKLRNIDSATWPVDTLLEYGPAEVFETMSTPRVIMTHFKPNRLPAEHFQNKGKVVFMLRNPKDAMVSYYHHLKDALGFHNTQTWDEFFDSYINGLLPFGSYFDYVEQWEQYLKDKPTDQHVEIFYYEDFKANTRYNIARLNTFLGFNRDQDYIEKVLEDTTLSALREQYEPGKRETAGEQERQKMVRDANGDSVIFRKGKVGVWKNYMTVAQSETVDRLLKERLKHGLINVRYEV